MPRSNLSWDLPTMHRPGLARRSARPSIRGTVPMQQPIPTNSLCVANVWLWSRGPSITRRNTANGSSFPLQKTHEAGSICKQSISPKSHTWITTPKDISSDNNDDDPDCPMDIPLDMVSMSALEPPALGVRGFKVGATSVAPTYNHLNSLAS